MSKRELELEEENRRLRKEVAHLKALLDEVIAYKGLPASTFASIRDRVASSNLNSIAPSAYPERDSLFVAVPEDRSQQVEEPPAGKRQIGSRLQSYEELQQVNDKLYQKLIAKDMSRPPERVPEEASEQDERSSPELRGIVREEPDRRIGSRVEPERYLSSGGEIEATRDGENRVDTVESNPPADESNVEAVAPDPRDGLRAENIMAAKNELKKAERLKMKREAEAIHRYLDQKYAEHGLKPETDTGAATAKPTEETKPPRYDALPVAHRRSASKLPAPSGGTSPYRASVLSRDSEGRRPQREYFSSVKYATAWRIRE